MHVRGKDFKYEATIPTARRRSLLDVPRYDFNWQMRTTFAEPQAACPRARSSTASAHFDNSANNPANPDPTKRVRWGEQTWEEMMIGFYTTVDPKQDLSKEAAGVKRTEKPAETKTSAKD